jgi:hypothetical protein
MQPTVIREWLKTTAATDAGLTPFPGTNPHVVSAGDNESPLKPPLNFAVSVTLRIHNATKTALAAGHR